MTEKGQNGSIFSIIVYSQSTITTAIDRSASGSFGSSFSLTRSRHAMRTNGPISSPKSMDPTVDNMDLGGIDRTANDGTKDVLIINGESGR